MKYSKEQFPEIYKHTKNNEIDILNSKKCSCLFCRQTYDARRVSDWSNENNKISAVCPECGMNAVVGDASGFSLDHDTLKQLNLTYFGEDYMVRNPDSLAKYISRYREGKITHKRTNEALYLKYLFLQVRNGDPNAAFYLGEYYEFGTQFSNPDLNNALFWYLDPTLRLDPEALARVGVINYKTNDFNNAYKSFAESMALGSFTGLMHFSDCYMEGKGVRENKNLACKILFGISLECYARFLMSDGSNADSFASLCYRLGKAYTKGNGVSKDNYQAIRYFLFADLGYRLLAEDGALIGDLLTESRYVKRRLNTLNKENGYEKSDPLFDLDTFLSSISPFESPKDQYNFFYPLVVHPYEFTKEEGTFSLRISYPRSQIILDVQNSFCDFVNGDIIWNFDHVGEVTPFKEGKAFNRIIGNGETSLSFYNTFANPPELIGEIYFDRSNDEESDDSQKA